jgi:peptidoglycan/xylan/chitin deacetylase (PgdA/CDA1 family)
VILLYHRVVVHRRDPFRLDVHPDRFRDHLDVLAERAEVVPLRRLVEGRVPPRAIAITFDDGYADIFEHAVSELERRRFPATLFAVSDAIGSDEEFWWDALERCLLDPEELPANLELQVAGATRRWSLAPHDFAPESPAWREACVYVESDASPRHALLRELLALLDASTTAEKRALLDQLHAWSGSPRAARTTHRVLERDELRALAQRGEVEIGAHTRTHPRLSTLPAAAQRDEIAGSRRALEEMLGREVSLFAYPHGARRDYDAASVAAVEQAGFVAACSNFDGRVSRQTQRFELPRHLVHDLDRTSFAQRLGAWMGEPPPS